MIPILVNTVLHVTKTLGTQTDMNVNVPLAGKELTVIPG